MRIKSRILLIDPDEARRAITRFVLETNGRYCVVSAASVYEATKVGRAGASELLVGFAPVSESYLMKVADAMRLPWLFIKPTSEIWPSMAVVLERVRIASSRKRGPQKKAKLPPVTAATIQPTAVAVA